MSHRNRWLVVTGLVLLTAIAGGIGYLVYDRVQDRRAANALVEFRRLSDERFNVNLEAELALDQSERADDPTVKAERAAEADRLKRRSAELLVEQGAIKARWGSRWPSR